jgi:hypothetical protein
MTRRLTPLFLALSLTTATAFDSRASHERFHKDPANPKSGLMAATDPTYVKECGSCHFPYSPGLLPARSWELHMERLEKHFGESVVLPAATRDVVRQYLVENAADRSPFEGSRYLMARISPTATPYRFLEVPLYREMHNIILEVISIKTKVKVRTLTNCNACHQFAADGSFGTSELVVPGLTPRVRTAR